MHINQHHYKSAKFKLLYPDQMLDQTLEHVELCRRKQATHEAAEEDRRPKRVKQTANNSHDDCVVRHCFAKWI